MKIKDRIEFKTKAPVLTFKADEMVMKAVKAMAEKNYGASVIVDDHNKPVGIVTERDFMRRLIANDLDAKATPISAIMTSDLRMASEDDRVVDWLRIMSNERFRHVPVISSDGTLINLMSQGDFVSYTWPQLLVRAKDVVTSSFMERFHLHLIVGSIFLYGLVMFLLIRYVK
jgi:CBS domain-containing protein